MARLFKLTVEMYPPSEYRPHNCVKVVEQIRTAAPNEILHFGFDQEFDNVDLDWTTDVITQALTSAIYRTVGVSQKLEF